MERLEEEEYVPDLEILGLVWCLLGLFAFIWFVGLYHVIAWFL